MSQSRLREYHNSFNRQSLVFQLPGVACLISDGSCYTRTELAIHGLNGAILQAYTEIGSPQRERLQITAVHERFHGHESSSPLCGVEVVPDTWVQDLAFRFTSSVPQLDCFHPNTGGAEHYAEQANLDALRVNR
jgi:hypothetical protein